MGAAVLHDLIDSKMRRMHSGREQDYGGCWGAHEYRLILFHACGVSSQTARHATRESWSFTSSRVVLV